MKTKVLFRNILITLILVFTLCGGALLASPDLVHAMQSYDRVLPILDKESYQLTSPINTYIDEEIVAFIQSDNSLTIYKDNTYTHLDKQEKNFFSLKHVERFGNNSLILSDNGTIYKVDLNTFEVSPLFFEKNIGGTSFNFNGQCLVTAYGQQMFTYAVDGDTITSTPFEPIEISLDTTIAINSTSVFYIDRDKICMRDFADFNTIKEVYAVVPSKMVAKDDALYYLFDSKIFRLPLDGSKLTQLALPTSDFDLGKVVVPTDITFLDDNLIITDKANDSIQEFSIQGDQLVFTGRAIAKNKTAYNRIGEVVSIEQYKNTLAVLDQNKLTLIDTNNVGYDENSFTNLFYKQAPKMFALGLDKLVCANEDQTVFAFNTSTNEQTTLDVDGEVKDICYKNGYFYILTNATTNSFIFKVNEADNTISKVKDYPNLYDLLEIDALSNFLFADSQNIYKDANLADGVLQSLAPRNNARKLYTDLSGKLYILNDTICSFDTAINKWKSYDFGLDSINDFSLNIHSSTIYFALPNQEYLYSTNSLENISISSTLPPSDLTFTGENANIDTLETYTLSLDAQVYNITLDDGAFSFNNLSTISNEYLLIKKIPNNINSSFILYLLADHNGIYLVNSVQANEKVITQELAPSEAYLTTTVHAYYMPLITLDMDYCLSINGQKVLLQKHAKIQPITMVRVLDMDFYFCTISDGNLTNLCYVPKNFTVEVLSQNKQYDKYYYENINATTIYEDEEQTIKILDVERCTVKVFSIENGVAYIEYNKDGQVIKGYINASSIINTSNNAVRNILILLAIITSLCGTVSFFILRKSI